ncbi:hypothetical protein [Aquicella lusitana]|uniref:Uncharacterized protein n=1 Tax=Aquicella lusitana TaxID=254246 RepID=A0A370GTS2_9COXI|nr:hypothetical protein [Aquicella lusitana]RDI46891.1 hypothetical protein C8D86_10413 [Aquicella lusitana]VVC73782.1 hypothetical protein AQULUS_15310 [Aquicella lusitana]
MLNRRSTFPAFFPAFFSSQVSSGQQTNSSSQQQTEAKDKIVWVFIWKMQVDSVGHAAIQIGGDQPKYTENDPGNYMSIWPKWLPSIGPTKIFPLKSVFANKLTEDQEAQSVRHQTSAQFEVLAQDIIYKQAPDFVYKLKDLDVDAMQKEAQKIKEGVKQHKVCYQLFPNISLYAWTRNLSPHSVGIIAENPFSGSVNKQLSKKISKIDRSLPEIYNCTSLVKHFVEIGGGIFSRPRFRTPWEITPDKLASELEKMNAEKVEISKPTNTFKF